jgi:hypothetical protein
VQGFGPFVYDEMVSDSDCFRQNTTLKAAHPLPLFMYVDTLLPPTHGQGRYELSILLAAGGEIDWKITCVTILLLLNILAWP